MHDWRSTSKSFGRDARNHPRDAGATTNHNDLGAFISRWRKAGASRRARRLGLATNGAHGVTRPTAAGGGKRGGRRQRPPGVASRRCQKQFWDGRTGQRAFEILSRELREGGEVAERRNDNSPAIPGWVKRQSNTKVPRGTAENMVAVRKDLSSLTGLWTIAGYGSQP